MLGGWLVGAAVAMGSAGAQAATYYLQAEQAEIGRGNVASNHAGFTGSGFVDYANETGSFVEWVVESDTDMPGVSLSIRYANGSSAARTMYVHVNGQRVGSKLWFQPTGAWTTWWTKPAGTVTLRKGLNTIRAIANTTAGGPNVDRLVVGNAGALTFTDWGRAVIDSTMRRFPRHADGSDALLDGAKWRYPQGLFLLGQYRAYQRRPERTDYLAYIRAWVDGRVDSGGNLVVSRVDDLTATDGTIDWLDTVMPGQVTLALALDPVAGPADPRYREVTDALWDSLASHRRLPAQPAGDTYANRVFWHSNKDANKILLDGAYMALPFMTRYGTAFNERLVSEGIALDLDRDAFAQLAAYRVHQQDKAFAGAEANDAGGTLLFYQAYDQEGNACTEVPTGGTVEQACPRTYAPPREDWSPGAERHSGAFWCRGMGWYASAIVDVLETLPPRSTTSSERAAVEAILGDIAVALERDLDPDSRLWFNVMRLDSTHDARSITDGAVPNYPESSCSALMVYALSKALANGLWGGDPAAAARYRQVAGKAYAGVLNQLGVVEQAVSTDPADSSAPKENRQVASLGAISGGQNPRFSHRGYLEQDPVPDNLHGLGAFLLMYEQVRRAPATVRP